MTDAIQWCERGLQIVRNQDDRLSRAVLLNNLTYYLLCDSLANNDKALAAIRELEEVFPDRNLWTPAWQDTEGFLYYHLASAASSNTKRQEYLKKAISIFERLLQDSRLEEKNRPLVEEHLSKVISGY